LLVILALFSLIRSATFLLPLDETQYINLCILIQEVSLPPHPLHSILQIIVHRAKSAVPRYQPFFSVLPFKTTLYPAKSRYSHSPQILQHCCYSPAAETYVNTGLRATSSSMSDSTWSHLPACVEYPRLPLVSHTEVITEQNRPSSSEISPTTPRKATPNTSRRRRGTPNLTRAEATPSHRVKMAIIFQEAAAEIQESLAQHTAGNASVPNTKRNRISLATYMQRYKEKRNRQPKASEPPFDVQSNLQAIHAPTPPEEQLLPAPPLPSHDSSCAFPVRTTGKEPLSSGFTSPVGPESNARYGKLPLSSSILPPGSDDGECHSTHGVPYIITPQESAPEVPPQMRNIDAWLDKLMDPAPEPAPRSPLRSSVVSDLGRSSPCAPLFSKKLRRPITRTKTCVFPTASAPGPRQPSFLYAPPTKPWCLVSLDKVEGTARNTSNKENLPPPTRAGSWNSVISSPPRNSPPHTNAVASPTDQPTKDTSPSLFLTPHHHTPSPNRIPSSTRAKSPALFLTPYLSAPPRRPPHLSPLPNKYTKSSPPFPHFRPGSPSPRPFPFAICEDEDDYTSIRPDEIAYPATNNNRTPHPKVKVVDKHDPWAIDSRDLEPEGEMPRLSPDVEVLRKGRGRGEWRRLRCGSYWDEDIVPEFSPKRGCAEGGKGGQGEFV